MSKKELVVGTSLVERPIAMLVQTAGRYASELHLQMDNKNINLTVHFFRFFKSKYNFYTDIPLL